MSIADQSLPSVSAAVRPSIHAIVLPKWKIPCSDRLQGRSSERQSSVHGVALQARPSVLDSHPTELTYVRLAPWVGRRLERALRQKV